MKMRILIFFLIFLPGIVFSQVNQTDANGLRQGFWQKKQDNGRLLYEGNFKDGKPVGKWKRYHPGGQLKALIVYKGDTAFTQLFDVWRNKLTEGDFLDQKKEGVWKIFKDNYVVADEEYRGGVKNGVSHQYFETGEVLEESHWKDGVKDGDYQAFYKNGQPYIQSKMKNGERNGLFLVFHENGQPEREAAYKNNLRHGEWKFYNLEGEYMYSLFYQEGKILNPQVRDSIDNLEMKALEKDKEKLVDPEKFMADPSGYMRKNNMFR